MGIKVEHQGNAASRIVASSLGGQAQASEKQSLALAQKAANENAASNRQLSGAHATAQPGHASVSPTHAGFVGAPNPADYAARAKLDFENAVGLIYAKANANVAQKPSITGTDLDPGRQKSIVPGNGGVMRGLTADGAAYPSSSDPATPQPPSGLELQFNNALQTASAALKRRLRGLDGAIDDPYGGRVAPAVAAPAVQQTPPTPSATLAAVYRNGGGYYGNGGVMSNQASFPMGTVDDTQKFWEMI